MIEINNLKSLENFFSDNLDTPLFAVLADLYYEKEEYHRSRKVCKIGLKKHPTSSSGNYILAKLELLNENLVSAEKLLKKTIKKNPLHLMGAKLLFAVTVPGPG